MMVEIVMIDGERLTISDAGGGTITDDGEAYLVVPSRHIRYVECHGVEVSRK